MKTVFYIFLILLISLSAIPPVFSDPQLKGNSKDAIYFSIIPKKNVDQQLLELQPLLQLLEEKLQRTIITIRPQSYHAVIEGILSRSIDFAILGPASYAKARARDNKIEAFASFAKKKGFITPQGSYYHSVLFTIKELGYKSIDDLKGKKIALTDPVSTSGSIIPNMEFSKYIGLPLKTFFSTYIYTGSHDRSIKSIVQKYADAAFVSSARIDEAVQKKDIDPDQIVILWKSKPIHLDPFVFSGGIDQALKNQIKNIMLSCPPQLDTMFKKMQIIGIVEVKNKDYQPIHDIIATQSQKGK